MIPYGDLRDLAYEKGPLVKMGLHKLAIDENDNGKTINLIKDQELELSLITNPSTGYTWQYLQYPNPNVIKETKHYLAAQGKNPGSPAIEYWIYSPIGPGVATISLKYSRSWSKGPPAKTFQVEIVV